jgi:putative membrane-bound dehydrogenase-like protein
MMVVLRIRRLEAYMLFAAAAMNSQQRTRGSTASDQSRTTRLWTRVVVAVCLGAVAPAFIADGRGLHNDGRQRAAVPLSPDEALTSFELEPGYRIELAAAEPLIQSPVAIAFDERGRMYVVENRGYPGPLEGAESRSPAEGAIALLEDTNGDGRFDKRTDFARQLTFPNGVLPWDGGIFVSCAPDLLYLKDTDGDGVADERRVVFTGFDTSKTSQLRFSHPTLGIDNWIYLTGGLAGGRVSAPGHPERPAVTLGTNDGRFNPLTLAFEATGGQGQFGLTFDDFGRRLTCSNRRPVMHVVLETGDLRRNPHLAFSQTVEDASAAGAQATVWPISGDTTTASFIPNLMSTPHAGTFTAASGVHVHRGDALPAADRGSVFVCESAQNLVQRQVLTSNGVTFTSRPARTARDFLASRDTWFRPVFAANGPDGALYIVDMYRRIIDHPQYVPEASRALLDFEGGRERGRIYRVSAAEWKGDSRPIDLGRSSSDELVRLFEHRNAWWRETAQRLLVQRRDRTAVQHLRRLVQDSGREVARVHALWTLDGLGALDTADIVRGLNDRHAGVRENAVRLAAARIATSGDLLAPVLRLADDPDARVRMRVALALGETADTRGIGALAALARRDGAQPWMRAAILSSVRERASAFLRAFLDSPASSPAAKALVMQDAGHLIGAAESRERCLDLIAQIADPAADPTTGASAKAGLSWQPAALLGIAQGLRTRGPGTDGRSAFMTLLTGDSPDVRAARTRVDAMLSRTTALALDAQAPSDQRLAAIALLGHTDAATSADALVRLLAPQHPADLQAAGVRAIVQLRDAAAAARLVETARWQSYTAQLREAVLSALIADDLQVPVLLDAVDRGAVPATAVGPLRRSRLMNHRDAAIQKRARSLFAAVESGDRMQAYERVRAAIGKRPANTAGGRQVFLSHCASCHAVDGSGGQVGPDLSGLRNQPADAILLHVVAPDYEISAGYQAYVVETRDRRTLVGRLESESPTSLTLRDGASQQHVILRSDVVSLSASTRSLMPPELERAMSEQDMADLIAWLKAERH